MNADRDQDHCDDILDFEFLVKQKSGEDDAQDRDQGIVDGNLADGVAGQQRVVDGEAYCGDGNQAEKDEDSFCGEYPGCPGPEDQRGQQQERTADLHAVACRPGDVHPARDDPGDQAAKCCAAGIEQDHAVAHKGDIRKEIGAGLDVDGDDAGYAQNDPQRFSPVHPVIRKDQGREQDQDEAAHGIEDGGPGAAVVAKADVGEHIVQGGVDDAQEHQPCNVAAVRDVGPDLFEMTVEGHRSACAEKAHAGKENLAAKICALDLKLLIAELDQRIGQGPSDHDKDGKKYFETIIL